MRQFRGMQWVVSNVCYQRRVAPVDTSLLSVAVTRKPMIDRHSQCFSLLLADPKHTPAHQQTHHGNTACCVTHFLQRRPSINWSKPVFQPNLPSFISHPSILHRWAVPQLCLPASCLNLFSIQARETRQPSTWAWGALGSVTQRRERLSSIKSDEPMHKNNSTPPAPGLYP